MPLGDVPAVNVTLPPVPLVEALPAVTAIAPPFFAVPVAFGVDIVTVPLLPAVVAPLESVTAPESPRLPNTLHATFPGALGDVLVMALDLRGFAVSAGSACASGSVKPSEVLIAMGRAPE